MQRVIDYQVLFVEGDGFVLASIPDLECDAVAPTASEALATLELLARSAVAGYERERALPRPSRLSLGRVQLPAPAPSARRHPRLRSLPPAAGGRL